MPTDHERIHHFNEFDVEAKTYNTSSDGRFATHKASQEKFIFKRCFVDKQSIKRDDPIVTAFVGLVFQLLLKDRAPDHWLVKEKNDVLVASKFLDGFNTCENILASSADIEQFQNVKGFHRYLAATIFLSEDDLNFGNFGVMKVGNKEVFAKIDHDFSLNTYLSDFQTYFSRLKNNIANLNYYTQLKNNEIPGQDDIFFLKYEKNIFTEQKMALEQKLKSKIDFFKLIQKLDDICDIVEKNQELILSYAKKQEEILANELNESFAKSTKKEHRGIIFCFDRFNTRFLYNLETKKFTSFGKIEGKSLSDVLLDTLNKHVETIRKSSKTLNIAAEICKNKTEDCINLVDKYVESYNKEDVQVGEASHFLNWLEVDQKISSDLIRQLKDKYCVSTANSQNSTPNSTHSAPQRVASNPTPLQQPSVNPQTTTSTPPQQKQPISGDPQKVASNPTPLQQPSVNPQTTDTTSPQQKQPISGDPQKVTSSAAPFEEILIDNETNNNLESEKQDNEPPITTHNSKQEHFLGISTRGWIIISTCAIVGALALYFLVPLILGALGCAVSVGAELGLGAAGALTGGVIGGGTACLTKVVISKCCGEEEAVHPA